ncbi:TSL-kinase interacting-like protein [Parasponia andersonii]|uniref:TSL-kinase interacting-like protein n=1 Tax=Parasponia andersonii TaxID=3476 RepID=A0A2P5BGB6_PARAD|nr:TSL-kinase interacting-like protein [Parasponia andersonii]
METAIERKKRTTKVPRDCRSSISETGANKFRRTGGQGCKITGECPFVKIDEHSLPCSTANGMPEELLDRRKGSLKESSAFSLYQEKTLISHTRIKLQLFPIDEGTRMGLEQDGHHPYLELTLRARKKIPSVLKHLNEKWGSSKVALGEPVLFPYNVHGGISCCRRWTMKDSDTNAGDIYALTGSPATFRLRYGWFSTSDAKTTEELSTPTPCDYRLQSDTAQKDCSSNVEKADKDEIQIVVTSEDFKLINDDGQRTDIKPVQLAAEWADDKTNISIGGLLSEASLQGKFKSHEQKSTDKDTGMQPVQIDSTRSLASWADSLTNISIGGLLSEVSLQGKFMNINEKSNGSTQSTQIISDSLDAFISMQSSCPQGPRQPSHDQHSSILDAEETCHAFPVQKFSSSGKRVSALNGSSGGGCHRDAGSKSFTSSSINEVNIQAEVPEEQAGREDQTGVLLRSQTCNDESSLGLAGIKWSESLGPFDLGIPASRKLIDGEKTGINGFFVEY